MKASVTQLTPTPSWTASFTTRIASNSQAKACAARAVNRPNRLDPKPEQVRQKLVG
jgi:hypothetical protein